MIHVELDRIYSEDDAVRQIREIIDSVDRSREPVVVTRSNKPRVVIIDIEHIEELTGRTVTPVTPMAQVMTPAPDAEALPQPAEPIVSQAQNELPDLPTTEDATITAPTLNLPSFNTSSTPTELPASEPAPAPQPVAQVEPAAVPTPGQNEIQPQAPAAEARPVYDIIQEGPFDPSNSSPLA